MQSFHCFSHCDPRLRSDIPQQLRSVAHKYVVFDMDTLANKRMARNLAATANPGVLLNLNERTDFGFVPYFATVQVDELGELDFFAQFYVRRNRAEFVHRRTNSPLLRIERSAASNIRTTRRPACPSLNGTVLFRMQSAK